MAEESKRTSLLDVLTSEEKQFFYKVKQHIKSLETEPRRGLGMTLKGSNGRQQSTMWRSDYETP